MASYKGIITKIDDYRWKISRSFKPEMKTDVIIYDYLDASSALTVSMFRKRLVAYRKMEYEIEAEAGSQANRMSKLQTNFFTRLPLTNG